MTEESAGTESQDIVDLVKADADIKTELATLKNELKWLKRIIPGSAGLVALLILVFWNIERGKIGDRVREALDQEGVRTAEADTRAARDLALSAQQAAQGYQDQAKQAVEAIQAHRESIASEVFFYPIEVLSVDHSVNGLGRHFNFNADEVDALLGRTNWNEHTFAAMNSRTGKVGLVILWRHENGGSFGTAHGRFEPWGASADGEWEIGDRVLFLSSAE